MEEKDVDFCDLDKPCLTIFCVLIVVSKVSNMYIKINGLSIRRLVSEAEAVKPFVLDHKLKFLADLIMKIMNVFTRRALYLRNMK